MPLGEQTRHLHSKPSIQHGPTIQEVISLCVAHTLGYNDIIVHVSCPLICSEDAHVTDGPGAGHYFRQEGDTGSGVKRSVSARHRDGVNAGYPNPLVQPVDTHGNIMQSFLISVYLCL